MQTIEKSHVKKDGKSVQYVTFKMTEAEFHEADEGSLGYCIKCGSEQFGCEPDARRYTCESCEKNFVYGTQELLIMGCIDIV